MTSLPACLAGFLFIIVVDISVETMHYGDSSSQEPFIRSLNE